MLHSKRILIVSSFLFYCVTVFTQKWEVPEDKEMATSLFIFSKETQKKGEAIFMQNCISCHGNPGKSNYVKLVPSPGDPASEVFQKQSDGAMFYKITTGRSPMPEFKNILTDEERWNVISYIRSFNLKYIQPEPAILQTGKYTGVKVNFKISYLPQQKKIQVVALSTNNKKNEPVSNIDISLYAKRYFGELAIDEQKTTNDLGIALFNYADSLCGDKEGNIKLIAKINTEGLNGFKKDSLLKIGKPLTAKSLIDTRAMWTVRSQAPIWLILAYSLVVLTVWSFLIYIVFQIFKIRKNS